jgi:DNA repair protein RecO (recombination protein O)
MGGVLCPACRQQAKDERPISDTCLKLARYLMAKDINETVLLKIHPRLNEELENLTKSYLLYHMERYQFRSLNLLSRFSEPTPMKPKMSVQQEGNSPVEEVLVQKKDSALTDAAEFDTFNETESSEHSHEQEE